MSCPIFWPIVFYSSFKSVLSSYFLQFLYFYFTVLYQFICRHSTYLYLSILSVRFATILLAFSQIFVHINIIFIYSFYNVSLLFTRFYRLRSLVCFRRNFDRKVTLKYLIWFQRDNFFYLSFSYYFILSCLFLTLYFTLFTLFLFYIFVFSF